LCVDDQKKAELNLEQLCDTVYEQVKGLKDPPSKDEVRRILQNIQTLLTDKTLTEDERDKRMDVVV
jgi:hypothetical protein